MWGRELAVAVIKGWWLNLGVKTMHKKGESVLRCKRYLEIESTKFIEWSCVASYVAWWRHVDDNSG